MEKNEKQFNIEELKAIIAEAKSATISRWGYCDLETYSGIRDFEETLIKTFEQKFEK